MKASYELGFGNDLFEQFSSPNWLTVELAKSIQEEVLPRRCPNSRPLYRNCFPLFAQYQRTILSMVQYELSEAAEVAAADCSGLHLNRPLAPRTFENRIDFEWLLAPIAHLLP